MSQKYNRTFHLPWSSGTSDDKIASSVDSLLNRKIIITEKLDGSCVCLEKDNCFARTHSGPPNHPSFDAFKSLHASVRHNIPEDHQIFGEWCYAKHSIEYTRLSHYFSIFNVRDQNIQEWASWDVVELWAEMLGVPTVPVLFIGEVYSEKHLEDLTNGFMKQPSCCGDEREGVVVRIYDSFKNEDFSKSVMKAVRPNHVATSSHWKSQEIIKNKLK